MGDHEGVRSSRTPRITKLERRRMRKLDRKISRLDWRLSVCRIINLPLSRKLQAERDKADMQRKLLRLWMKGVIE